MANMAASNQHDKHDSFISLDIEEEDHDLVIENYPLCKFLSNFSSSWQVFEDALEEPVLPKPAEAENRSKALNSKEVSLPEGLAAARESIDKFLNNHFDEARAIVQPL